jgi:tetratricopeptide (TPR) repeat protein
VKSLAHFDLVERLGVGGFGSVWKARDRKLDRTVAVKIPRQGILSDDDLEKFFREARAAAQLQHPNIVRVHEVSRDGDSVFIVSDFVRGTPLNDWLTAQQPTMREAAEICATIADALQHAHGRGVIHRDLKPANVLIDGEGRPQLMDFGLAKREAGEVTVTVEGQVLGTPAYMSPELAQGEAHTVDRRSDLYSLGVILFELLAGELPFRGNARMLMHQVIQDEPPSPRKFNGNIPRDLETITLRCLQKRPERRYQSAQELATELRRYLAGQPILARPIGRLARAGRWAKRRPAAATLLALLFVLAGGSAAAFLRERELRSEVAAQRNEAEVARANAEAVVHFLTNDVLAKASPIQTQFKTASDTLVKALIEPSQRRRPSIRDRAVSETLVKALIEPAAATVGERFQDKPLIKAAIRRTLAQTLEELGRPDLALPHALEALELHREILGDDHLETITSLSGYAVVLESLGRAQEAELLCKRALEQRRRILGDDHPETIKSLNNYAHVLGSLNRWQEAEPLYSHALALRRKVLGEDHPDSITSLNDYALVLRWLGRGQEAEPLLKRALTLNRKVLEENHPETFRSMTSYAILLESLGRTEEAESFYRQSTENFRKVLGDDHPNTIVSMFGLASACRTLGRLDEAEKLYRQAMENARRVLGEDHSYAMIAKAGLASVYSDRSTGALASGHLDEACRKNAEVLKLGFAGWSLTNAKSNSGMLNHVIETAVDGRVEQTREPIDALILGELCLVAGKLDHAETAIRAAIRKGGTEHFYDKSLGWCLLAQGRDDEARHFFHNALKSCRRDDGSYHLENASVDHMTAAYFLDLMSEAEYVERVTADKRLGSYPWFYVGQRREIEGNKAAALAAYQRCVEPGTAANATTVYALAHWRLHKLSEQTDYPE